MGLLDAQLHVGKETVYGTPVPTTRSFEAYGDGHKRPPAFLESKGARAGIQALRSDKRRVLNMGAEGEIEVDVLTKGMGLLLEQMFGSSTIVQQGATTAWDQTHTTTADGPSGKSLTVKLGVPDITGTVRPKIYHGGKVKEWELSQEVGDDDGGLLKLKLGMDYEDEDTAGALDAAAYIATPEMYAWPDLVCTVNGAQVDIKDMSVKGDNNLDTDRRYARGSQLKKEPLRKGVPEYEGSIKADFIDLTQYNRFVAGTIVPIVFTWTGGIITGAVPFKLQLTLPACQFSGETPEFDLDNLTEQNLPFKVLHNGTNPAITCLYTSTDVAL